MLPERGQRRPMTQESHQGWFRCSCCGEVHDALPTAFSAKYPDPYADRSPEARELHAEIGTDQCIINGEEFYILGCLEIPIHGTEDVFSWGVWARINEPAFDEISDYWETEGRETMIGPYCGRLANTISVYPDTLNLLLNVRISPAGSRPQFVLREADHLLSREQRTGMSREQAEEYACMLMRRTWV